MKMALLRSKDMKNIFIIHSLNGDTLEFWGQDVKQKFEDKLDVYMPKLPIRAESKYEKFDEILSKYLQSKELNEDFAELLRLIHKKLEQRYKEILLCFTGKDNIPDLYTRHQILKKKDVLLNVERANFQDSTKEILIAHVDKIKSITNEQFQRLISRPNLRDTLICLRWLAYSVGFFSENYINDEISYKDRPLYINVTPRLFTKIGGASILNFPDYPIVKIDRGLGDVSKEEFEKKSEFHKEFTSTL